MDRDAPDESSPPSFQDVTILHRGGNLGDSIAQTQVTSAYASVRELGSPGPGRWGVPSDVPKASLDRHGEGCVWRPIWGTVDGPAHTGPMAREARDTFWGMHGKPDACEATKTFVDAEYIGVPFGTFPKGTTRLSIAH